MMRFLILAALMQNPPATTLPEEETQVESIDETVTGEPGGTVTLPEPESPVAKKDRAWTIAANVSPLGFAVPFKYGMTAGRALSPKWSLAAQGLYGTASAGMYSATLASVEEKHLGAIAEFRPWAGHFYLLTGLGYQTVNVTIGNDTLKKYSAGNIPGEYKVLSVEALTLALGFGHRWQMRNGLTFGLDWMVLNIPVAQTKVKTDFLDAAKTTSDGRNASSAFDLLKRAPTVSLFNVGIGYSLE